MQNVIIYFHRYSDYIIPIVARVAHLVSEVKDHLLVVVELKLSSSILVQLAKVMRLATILISIIGVLLL
jgi:hypothetical protein